MALKPASKAHPLGRIRPKTARDMVAWVRPDTRLESVEAGPELTQQPFHLTRPARYAPKFNTATNYHGQYYFAGHVGRLIWHESMLEYSSLMWLDHTEHVIGISAQPMMLFLTGLPGEATHRRHTPDYFALLEDGRQLVIDVYSPSRLDLKPDLAVLLDRTEELCQEIGWEYRRFNGLPRQTRHNLEAISGFRHPRYAPTPQQRDRILDHLAHTSTFADTSAVLDPELPARHIHTLYHLIWTRKVAFDMTRPLTAHTELRKTDHA